MEILYSSGFRRAYKKLAFGIKKQVEAREKIFRSNPFNPILKTHKLHGKYRQYWAFSLTASYRVMFKFHTKDEVAFVDVNDHDVYK